VILRESVRRVLFKLTLSVRLRERVHAIVRECVAWIQRSVRLIVRLIFGVVALVMPFFVPLVLVSNAALSAANQAPKET
jgi:hypothetical protein